METFWRGLLISYVFTATVYGLEDAIHKKETSNSSEYEDEIAAAENHEHHRIIIVVPKEMPQHVNHVHTYKLADKGIPLIHSGKVIHDHKHNGKVAHEHGHAGKSSHTHKHFGSYGHQHKHDGKFGHNHVGYIHRPKHKAPLEHNSMLHNAAHKLHLRQQQQLYRQLHHNGGDYQLQVQHGNGGGSSGVIGVGPAAGQVQFVPSSKPKGLGSFMPAEIQQYVQEGRGYPGSEIQQQQLYHQNHQQQQQQQDVDDGDDENGHNNVIRLRVPDHNGPKVIKHVDIDLANNVAKLQTGGKQVPVTANFKRVTQYNKVIGHGRAVPIVDEEFNAQTDDDDVDGVVVDGGGGELSLEDEGYRFGEGYKLAMDLDSGRDFSEAQEQDEEEADEFNKEPQAAVEDDDTPDGNAAYSHTYVKF